MNEYRKFQNRRYDDFKSHKGWKKRLNRWVRQIFFGDE
jgi:hypothetical protein